MIYGATIAAYAPQRRYRHKQSRRTAAAQDRGH